MKLDKLKKKHKKKVDRFKRWVRINPVNIDEELRKNPSRLFSVGLKLGEAELLMDKAKAIWDRVEGQAKMYWSKKKRGDGKSYTIPQIEAKVSCDDGVLKARETYIEAKYIFNICKSAAASMKEKGQQLTNIANNRRAESKYNYVKEGKEERVKKRLKNH